MSEFIGKVAAVTGAASGIGRATALAFAAAGARVAVLDIDREHGEETVELIRRTGGDALYVPVDVANEADVDRAFAAVVAELGALDVAHNNAGVDGKVATLLDTPLEEWRKVIDVDLTSVFLCLKAEIRIMRERGGGSIVNTASASGLIGGYNHGAYTAAKHGVVGLTKAAAMEWIDDGIRINAVCPGPINTPFMTELPPGIVAQLLSGTPAGRLGEPAEIAEAVLWLASDRASYMVGHALAVDGGTVLGGTATKFPQTA